MIADAGVYNPKKLLGAILRVWDDASIFKVYLA